MRQRRIRLDEAVVAAGLVQSRSRARDAILRGRITVDGVKAAKPGQLVAADAALANDDPAAGYVSRGALKLSAGLDRFGFDPAGRTILDLGASTGGFTQVLLERGAARVIAVDVGHGQMAPALAADPRVLLKEGFNARDLCNADLAGHGIEAITCDVSFISLKLALPPALRLAEPGAWGLFLVKPQFEVGPERIGKGGLVRDIAAAEAAACGVFDWLAAQPGWEAVGLAPSPLAGRGGNREFLLGARRA